MELLPGCSLTVDVLSVRCPVDCDYSRLVIYGVGDSEAPRSEPVFLAVRHLCAPLGTWVVGRRENRSQDPPALILAQLPQVPLGRVCHLEPERASRHLSYHSRRL